MMIGVLFTTALTGCTRIQMNVTTYLSHDLPFPEPSPETRVAVIAKTEEAEPLLEREVQQKIEVLLRARGYTVTSVPESSHLIFAYFAIDSGTTATGVMPIFTPGGVATSDTYTSTGQWATTTTQLPGHTNYVPYRYTFFTRFLGMHLYQTRRWAVSTQEDRGDAVVWKSTTVSSGSKSDLREVIDFLLVGTFDYFGRDTGKQKTETMFEASRSVSQLKKAVATAPASPAELSDVPIAHSGQVDKPRRKLRDAGPPPDWSPASAGGVDSGVIESKVDGEFEGFEGETVLKLMDGSIWEQEEYYYHYHYAYMPDVVVYRSAGSWKMQVKGVPKAVRVQRLK